MKNTTHTGGGGGSGCHGACCAFYKKRTTIGGALVSPYAFTEQVVLGVSILLLLYQLYKSYASAYSLQFRPLSDLSSAAMDPGAHRGAHAGRPPSRSRARMVLPEFFAVVLVVAILFLVTTAVFRFSLSTKEGFASLVAFLSYAFYACVDNYIAAFLCFEPPSLLRSAGVTRRRGQHVVAWLCRSNPALIVAAASTGRV